MRVVFYVRCHGEPDDELEAEIENRIYGAIEVKERGWGILTIGRQYYHENPMCPGHPDAKDDCENPVTGQLMDMT